jgi:hypothetical protein
MPSCLSHIGPDRGGDGTERGPGSAVEIPTIGRHAALQDSRGVNRLASQTEETASAKLPAAPFSQKVHHRDIKHPLILTGTTGRAVESGFRWPAWASTLSADPSIWQRESTEALHSGA